MNKKYISLVLAIVIILVLAVPALAKGPVPGNPSPRMDWNPAYAGKAHTLVPYSYDRGNASGDKIPSNAHSADFPGLYFYWNDKQKDNGVLLVDKAVFDLFKDGEFTVTAKTSNCYWGHIITADEEAYDTESGLYIFNIFRNAMYKDKKGNLVKDDMKNINMIFIDGEYKPANFKIEKLWLDYNDNKILDNDEIEFLNGQLKFNNGYKLGMNEIKINDYKTAWYGKTITVIETSPAGFAPVGGKDRETITINCNELSTVIFKNKELGAKINISKNWLDNSGEAMSGDDSLVVLTGEWELGLTTVAPGINVKFGEELISGFTLIGITVDGEPVTDIDFTTERGATYNIVLTNRENDILTLYSAEIEKWVDGQFIIDWLDLDSELTLEQLQEMMSFKLFSVTGKDADFDEEDDFVADGELQTSGIISFGDVEEGWYAIVEYLTEEGAEIFEEVDPQYVYVGKTGVYNKMPVSHISGEDFGTIVSHSGGGVNFILPDVWDGVLAGQPAYEALKKMGAKWVWDVEDTYVYGVTGSVYTDEFTFTADKADTVTGYLAADNAAVVYVNGKLAGYTEVAFSTPSNVPAPLLADFNYGAMDASIFDGGWATGWNYSYSFDIEYIAGENTVTIIAANSARTTGTGEANDGYDTTNNPCGLLFGFVTPPEAVFNNYTKEPPRYGIEIEKWVDDYNISVWAEGYNGSLSDLMSFELFKQDDEENWVTVAPGTMTDSGFISFGTATDFEQGDYMLVETLTPAGELIFVEKEDPMYFTVKDDDYNGVFFNDFIPEPEMPDRIESHSHFDKWWGLADLRILAGGGNSLNGKVFFNGFSDVDNSKYFIAFDSTIYSSVTIGFGSSAAEAAGNSKTFNAGDGDILNVVGDAHHAFGGAKKSDFGDLEVIFFENPNGSGAMHVYLLDYKPVR